MIAHTYTHTIEKINICILVRIASDANADTRL